MPSTFTDNELAAAARDGSHAAFEELVRRYRAALVRFAYRLTGDADEANDVAQDALLRAYRSLATFEPERPFARWLFAIARNAAHDVVRRARRTAVLSALETSGQAEPETVALRNAERSQLRAALAALPPPYRAVLELHYFAGLRYREIADALGIPIGTVKTHMRRAKRRMRDDPAASQALRAA